MDSNKHMVNKLFKMHHKIKLQLDAICQEAGDMNVEEFMQVYKSLEQGRASELQMQEASAMAEQYKFAMPNPSGINIYAGTNENAELSNFANRPYTNELGVEFRNVEAAFQYAKTNWAGGDNNPNNDSIRMELQTATGAQAKALGRKIKGLDVKAWDQNSEAIMKSIIKDSFEQNYGRIDILTSL